MTQWAYDNPFAGRMTRWVRILLYTCIAMFVVQAMAHTMGLYQLDQALGLSLTGVRTGKIWQFVTYMFLHGSVLHLVLNMIGLYFIGPELERSLGSARFLTLYFISGLLGGVGWLILMYPFQGICIGASGAIFGLLGAFAALFPHRQITLLVFFVLPVTMKAWVLALVLGLMQLLMMISPDHGGIAYAAHLAGGLAGYIYGMTQNRRFPLRMPVKFVWKGKGGGSTTPRPGDDRAEIDRILDKIAEQGIHTLTPKERNILENASRNRGRNR